MLVYLYCYPLQCQWDQVYYQLVKYLHVAVTITISVCGGLVQSATVTWLTIIFVKIVAIVYIVVATVYIVVTIVIYPSTTTTTTVWLLIVLCQ